MKNFYFVGNAHLDPVWMWRWQEGSAEAKATVRSALDRMKEYPDFKFVCSSVSVYKWIEDFAPEMFEEVRERIEEGRFIIVGGQFVQPDCNLPSGEGFARQSLYSQRYFYDRFGKTAKVGYNVDSFGHNLMLPQILKKCGMDKYVFMRPGPHEKTLPENVFRWKSPDGSEILAYRIHEQYCYNMKTADELEEKISKVSAFLPEDNQDGMIFYGVGNHGGGPTKQNLNIIHESKEAHPERNYIFSDVNDYFEKIEKRKDTLPVWEDDLQHHASGCYSAVSMIKDLVRKSENALLSAESANMTAAFLTGKKYTTKELAEAWENVIFCHFHDIIGGCSIEEAYTDASYMLGESISKSEKIKNSAHQTISWMIDTKDMSKGYPIVVFNTLPNPVESVVEINKYAKSITTSSGEEVPIQHVHASSFLTYGRENTIFKASVGAMGYSVYYIKENDTEACENSLSAWDFGMENEYIRVEFEEETGYIKSIYNKDGGRQLLSGYGAVPCVIDEEGHDTWSHAKNYFTKEIAKFSDATVKVVENGPVRVMIEVTSKYNKSTLKQYFSLSAGEKSLDVNCEIDWHEEHKMLKIAFETASVSKDVYYEIPFGVIKRPANGEEEPGYRWLALKDETHTYAIVNSNKYSFSAIDNTMYLTAVRSPYYADHGRAPNDRCRFSDQGSHRFEYSFLSVDNGNWQSVINKARKLNTKPDIILENNHNGTLSDEFSGIYSSEKNVQISALKRSEDGKGTVIRIYETDGKETAVTINGALLPESLSVNITPFSVDTYYIEDKSTEWRKVLMTEFEI